MPSVGSWSPVLSTPAFAVHAAVVYRPGTEKWKVMLFSGGAEATAPPTGAGDLRKSYLWDPDTGSFSSQPFALAGPDDKADPFCSHHAFLPDGRLLVMGGALYGGGGHGHGRGIRAAWIFDPSSESWSRASDMSFPRWYPTPVVLPDGRVLVASGRDTSGGVVEEMEIFDPSSGSWSTLPAAANRAMDIYPSLHLVGAGRHAGKVFYTGTRWAGGSGSWNPPAPALFDPSTNGWQTLDRHDVENRSEGFSVPLPPARCARYLVTGGGHTAGDADPDSAEVIDLRDATPTWRRVQDMHHDRTNVSGVLLPNGRFFAVGGHTDWKFGAAEDEHVLTPEIYDPASEGWIEAAPMAEPRQYHSVAVLLPDGRVLCAGGIGGGGGHGGHQEHMEIYSPPYMQASRRPGIASAPDAVGYGATFAVSTPRPGEVDRAVLVKPMSVTHHTDSHQRLVDLDFGVRDAGTLQVTAPGAATLAPPGYYMLFLVDRCGVPSVARFIRIGAGGGGPKGLKEKEIKDVKEGEKVKEVEKDLRPEKLIRDKDEKDVKEAKEGRKDKGEKELKEGAKEKEIPEGGGGPGGPGPGPLPPGAGLPGLGRHFIRPEERPDLTGGALREEIDVEPVDPGGEGGGGEGALPEELRRRFDEEGGEEG